MEKHIGKKLLAVLLVIMLAVPASLAAFAEETVTEPVCVGAWEDENKEETVNANIDVDGGQNYETAVSAESWEGGHATLTVTGDVSVDGSGSSGARAISSDDGSISTTTVNGNVDASSTDENNAEGAAVHAYDGGTGSVTVNGNVSSTDVGVDAYAAGGTAEITVNGNVTAEETGVTVNVNRDWTSEPYSSKEEFDQKVSGDPDDVWDGTVNGDGSWWSYESWHDGEDEYRIETYHYFVDGVENTEVHYYKMTAQDLGGSAEVMVDGSITASNAEGAATGLNVWTDQQVTDADIDVTVTGDVTATGTQNQDLNYSPWTEGVNVNVHNDAEADVLIGGNVTATSTEYAQGVSATAYDNSNVTVTVGDVKVSAEEDSNGVNARTEGGTLNLSVGDITSDGTGLTVSSQGGDVTASAGDVTSQRDAVQATLDPKRDYTELSAAEFSAAVSGIGSDSSWSNSPNADGSYWGGESWRIGDDWYYANICYGADGTVLEANYNKQTATATSGTVNVTVNGDVNAVNQDNGVNGVWVYGDEKTSGTIDVTVTGDVNVEGAESSGPYSSWTSGVSVNANEDINATVTIGGNVSAVSNAEASGVNVNVWENGTADVTVGGTVTEKGGTDWDSAVRVSVSGEKARATVQTGNVVGDETGVQINVADGTANVTTGSVTATETAVQVGMSGEWANTELTAEEFAALNLGEARYNYEETLPDGTIVTYQEWYEDGVNYQVVTSDSGTTIRKSEMLPSGGAITLNVNGSVTANNEDGYATALNIYTGSKATGEVEVNVSGDVSATSEGHRNARGISANASADSSAIVSVDGNVSVVQNDGTAEGGDYIVGIDAGAGGGLVSVTVAGDVDVTSLLSEKRSDTMGVRATTTGEDAKVAVNVNGDVKVSGENAVGVEAYNGGGRITVDVNGNIVSDGNGISSNDGWYTHWEDTTDEIPFNESEYMYTDTWVEEDGTESQVKFYKHKENNKIYWYADNGHKWVVATNDDTPEADTQVAVFGDVTAKDYGAYIEVKNDKAVLDLLVDGTLSGEKSSILLNDDTLPGNVTLTVWEVKANSDGNLAEKETWVYNQDKKDYDQVISADKEFEKQIQYIIRLDQPSAGATLATSGTSAYEGYDVANEGDTVILKVDVEPGYFITGAYNGTDTKVELLRDESGQYYLVVPRGGAVLLSVTLGYAGGSAEEEEENTPAPVVNDVQEEKMDDEAITAAVEELLTKNDVIENSTVEVRTDASGAKTVVISPEEIGTAEGEGTESEEAGEAEEVVLKLTVPAEMLTQLSESDVGQITMVSKSGTATVSLDVAAVKTAAESTQGAKLIVNIEENSGKIQKATEALPAGYTAKAGAVAVTARIEDAEGNIIVLDSSANITIQLNIDYEEGMKILYVDENGNVTETEAVWVEATEDVPGHWEVPFLGEGTYIPVVGEEAK